MITVTVYYADANMLLALRVWTSWACISIYGNFKG